jgi:hypothetical protein
MLPRRLLLPVLLLCLTPIALAAQAMRDQTRLVIGIAGGYIGGKDLWAVPNQPINAIGQQTEIFDLGRRLRSNVTMSATGTYFPGSHLGYTGDVSYLGLGTVDRCRITVSTGDFVNEQACRALDGNQRSASAVAAMGGVTIRPLSRAVIQPYARVLAGVAIVPRGPGEMISTFGIEEDAVLPIYLEENRTDIKPAAGLVLGFATANSNGYQFRVEARGTWVRLPVVTGATAQENLAPPSSVRSTFLPSIIVGMDIVLEKRRGRRY